MTQKNNFVSLSDFRKSCRQVFSQYSPRLYHSFEIRQQQKLTFVRQEDIFTFKVTQSQVASPSSFHGNQMKECTMVLQKSEKLTFSTHMYIFFPLISPSVCSMEKETELSFASLTPQMPATAKDSPSSSQKSRIPSKAQMQVAQTQSLEAPAVSQGLHQQEAVVKNGAGTQTKAL